MFRTLFWGDRSTPASSSENPILNLGREFSDLIESYI